MSVVEVSGIKMSAIKRSHCMVVLDFSEKGLEIVSVPHFVYEVSKKMFLMLHSIN